MKIENKILDINKQWNDLMSTENKQFVSFMEDVQNKLLLNISHVNTVKYSKNLENKPGIYCFFINEFEYNSYLQFCKVWDTNHNNDEAIKHITRPVESRFEKDQGRGVESYKTVFYIGKRRLIKSRLKEHINHTTSTTFSLKLSRKGADLK